MFENIIMFVFVLTGGFLAGMRFAEQRIIRALSVSDKEDKDFDRLP